MEWCVPTAGSPGPTDGPQPTGRQAAGQVMLLTFSAHLRAHTCALSRQCRCSRCAATWHGRPNVVELFIANRRCRRHTSSTSSVSIHGSAVTDTRPRRADAGRWPDRAHRLGYGLADGFDALLVAEVVAHRFDNPLCQLPEHWRESTHAQNGSGRLGATSSAARYVTCAAPVAGGGDPGCRAGRPLAKVVAARIAPVDRDQLAQFEL
jgi:hypothetical protein